MKSIITAPNANVILRNIVQIIEEVIVITMDVASAENSTIFQRQKTLLTIFLKINKKFNTNLTLMREELLSQNLLRANNKNKRILLKIGNCQIQKKVAQKLKIKEFLRRWRSQNKDMKLNPNVQKGSRLMELEMVLVKQSTMMGLNTKDSTITI